MRIGVGGLIQRVATPPRDLSLKTEHNGANWVGGVLIQRVATPPRDLPLKTERNAGNQSCPRLVTVHQSVIQDSADTEVTLSPADAIIFQM